MSGGEVVNRIGENDPRGLRERDLEGFVPGKETQPSLCHAFYS
jgi:hypothetical protein